MPSFVSYNLILIFILSKRKFTLNYIPPPLENIGHVPPCSTPEGKDAQGGLPNINHLGAISSRSSDHEHLWFRLKVEEGEDYALGSSSSPIIECCLISHIFMYGQCGDFQPVNIVGRNRGHCKQGHKRDLRIPKNQYEHVGTPSTSINVAHYNFVIP